MIKNILTMMAISIVFAGMVLTPSALGKNTSSNNASAQEDRIAPTDVFGQWRTPDKALIDVQPCGESVCGTLVWFSTLEGAQEPILDTLNKDEALRSRELKGILLIYDFEKRTKGWRKGKIYDPGSGTLYKSKLTRLDGDSLKVEGCVGPICKKFIWTRESE